MSKTIEEIRNQVAKENAFDDWEDLCFCHGEMTSIKRFENLTKFFDEVAERYAQSQTQELIEQNRELVDILSRIVEKQFDSKYSLQSLNIAISEAKELLTKYNHLNQM